MGENKIELVLVDERPLVRAGVKRIIESEADLRVVAEASNVDEAAVVCRSHSPDVVVLGIDLPGPGLMRAVQRLRKEGSAPAVVVLSPRDGDDELFHAVVAGAAGHVAEAGEPQVLAEVIRQTAAGLEPISRQIARRPAVSQRVLETYRQLAQLAVARPDSDIPLTLRERRVLGYVAQGLTNRQIGRQLGLSENTVKAELSGITRQLGLRGRTEAVVFAVRRGWIGVSPPN